MTSSDASSPGFAVIRSKLDADSLQQLQGALADVEKGRGLLVRLADLMGGAIGQAARLSLQGIGLAPSLQAKFQGIAEVAITRAFDVAIMGMSKSVARPRHRLKEGGAQVAVALSGAVGGFSGALGLLPDVGFTTLTIMREIADIARQEGEDLSDPDTRRACLEVFALRSFASTAQGEESELGFFSARALMRGRPIVMLIGEVASHYGMGLSRKFALQMMPVAGALCGASLNAAFLAHYRSLARAHFTIRRLERIHGLSVRETADHMAEAAREGRSTT